MLTQSKWRRAGWILMTFCSVSICLFSLSYFIPGMPYGFRPDFYPQSAFTVFLLGHIAGAIVAALTGPLQFWGAFRKKYLRAHRILGKCYVVGVAIAGFCALVIAPVSQGGMPAHTGFMLLAMFWIACTAQACVKVYQKDWVAHRQWMIRSFSLTLAFISLRLWLPALLMTGAEFEQVYPTVAWLCWVPNLIISEMYLMRESNPRSRPVDTRLLPAVSAR